MLKKNFFSNLLMILGVVWIAGTPWVGLTAAVGGIALIVVGSMLRAPS